MERENVATVSRLDKETFVDRRSIVIFDFTWGRGKTLAFVCYIIFTIGKRSVFEFRVSFVRYVNG